MHGILIASFPLKEVLAVVAAICGSIVALLGFIKWWLPWRKKEEVKINTIQEMRSIQRIYEYMSDQLDDTVAERVIIFAGHDSGKIPKAGSPYYMSSVYWKVCHKKLSKEEALEANYSAGIDIADYREIPVDGHYIGMLLHIYEHGDILIKTEELPECQLKSYYTTELVTESLVIYLGFVDCNFLYQSIATFDEGGFSAGDLTKIRLKAVAISHELGI